MEVAPGSWWPSAAFAQIAGASLAREQRRRCLHPFLAACAAARRPPSRSDAARAPRRPGSSASTIVLSPGLCLASRLDALERLAPGGRVRRRGRSRPGRRARSPSAGTGPVQRAAAPPTLEMSAIATVLSTAPASACSEASELLDRLPHPRFMLVPWSPSPIAVSSRDELLRGARPSRLRTGSSSRRRRRV